MIIRRFILAVLASGALLAPAHAQETASSAVEAAKNAIEAARKAGGEQVAGDDLAAARSWYSQAEKAHESATSLLGRVATAAMKREREEEILYLARMARVKADTAAAKTRRVAVQQELKEVQKLLAGFQGALAIAQERKAAEEKAKTAQAATEADRRQLEEAQRKLAESEAARKKDEQARAVAEKQRQDEQAKLQEKLAALEKERAVQAQQAQALERERAMVAAAGRIPQTTSRVVDGRVVISAPVANLFAPSSELSPAGRKVLDGVGDFLKGYPRNKVQVRGHTDDRGAAATNQALSAKRAEAVRAYLVGTKGVPGDSVSAEGVGGGEPVSTNANDAGRALNRRVDLSVSLAE